MVQADYKQTTGRYPECVSVSLLQVQAQGQSLHVCVHCITVTSFSGLHAEDGIVACSSSCAVQHAVAC